ncbi:MAG: glycosyltransferase family 9 protein [Dehalococcoidia bacterium]|nr:glycosyltransferase family 9 protein [Dehalococcoidia bacterium]
MKILVVKLADIGDVLTATPALRSLRRTLPDAIIDILVPPGSKVVMDGSPLVNNILLFRKGLFDSASGSVSPRSLAEALAFFVKLRGAGYDSVAIMHHLTTTWGAYKYAALSLGSGARITAGLDNGKGWFLTHKAPDCGFGAKREVEYCMDVAKLLGADGDTGPMELTLSKADFDFAEAALPDGRPIIAIHAGSGSYSQARRWPEENFADLAELLSRDGAFILVVGGPGEEELGAYISRRISGPYLNMAGKTTIKQLGALLGRCDAFVGSDSGVMHVASAVGTQVIAIFGPSNHKAWGPWTGSNQEAGSLIIRSDIPCSPCLYVGLWLGSPRGCPARTCLYETKPRTVADATWKLIGVREERNENSWSPSR